MFQYCALGAHYLLCLLYTCLDPTFSLTHSLTYLSPILHTLAFLRPPHCYANHCQKPIDPRQLGSEVEQQRCAECQLVKWIRMHHCYRCKVCVHKYDHHCVLLGICIGEANQRYYLLLLWAYFYFCYHQLRVYFRVLPDHIRMDENGYEYVSAAFTGLAFLVIFCLLSIIVTGYLAFYHTFLAIHNDTTYQRRKRPGIGYLRGCDNLQHPFDRGIAKNLKSIFVDSTPIAWWDPSDNSQQPVRVQQDNRSNNNQPQYSHQKP